MDEKRNIRFILEYDGRRYHGWQRQKGAPTIQEIIEDRLQMIVQEPVTLIALGRTDAGVHALNQVCNFISGSKIAPESIKRGLNSLLPDDICIREAEYVSIDFHSRYSAKSKTYEYRILNQTLPNPFLRFYTWNIREKLDLEEMEKCVSLLRGKHDFSAFMSSGSGNVNPVREMIRSELHSHEQGTIHFIFEANGFLRHMVRNIVGTIVEVGHERRSSDQFAEILRSKDRRLAGIKAPPQGLFLIKVHY